jgi:DNA-binding PadR family transcriptional regulator
MNAHRLCIFEQRYQERNMIISPQTVYDNLKLLEQEDVIESAIYRELAQEVLADPKVSLSWRQAIADRLHQANHLLALLTVDKDDSY